MVEELYVYLAFIEVLVEIVLLIQFKRTSLKKYWYGFLGINIISILAPMVAPSIWESDKIFISDAKGFGIEFVYAFICAINWIGNIILLVISLIINEKISIKNNKKEIEIEENKKKNVTFFIISSVIVLICNLYVLIVVPVKATNDRLDIVKNNEVKVIQYLNKKYGEANYEVINISRKYIDAGNGGWNKEISGYYYEVKCDYMKDTFLIEMDDESIVVEEDYFIPVYYSEKYNLEYTLFYNNTYEFDEFNEYIRKLVKDKYSMELNSVDVRMGYQNNKLIIPDYGRIPTIDEIVDLLAEYHKEREQKNTRAF